MAGETVEQALEALVGLMERLVASVSLAAAAAQETILNVVLEELALLETKAGALVRGQNLRLRLAKLEVRLNEAMATAGYTQSVTRYLGSFTTIEARNLSMHKRYNDLEVDAGKLTPARKFVKTQAEYYLQGAGLAEGYIQPAKFLLMQQVTTGMSIADSEKMLKKWTKGELTDGKQTLGRQTPNLERYATQLSRDTLFQYQGTIQEIIKEEYGLGSFIYTGDVIADSRPLCRYLVGLHREIQYSELPPLLVQFPQGVIKGTTPENFNVFRGGYSCRHGVLAVRTKAKKQ